MSKQLVVPPSVVVRTRRTAINSRRVRDIATSVEQMPRYLIDAQVGRLLSSGGQQDRSWRRGRAPAATSSPGPGYSLYGSLSAADHAKVRNDLELMHGQIRGHGSTALRRWNMLAEMRDWVGKQVPEIGEELTTPTTWRDCGTRPSKGEWR